jgi:hypothetical protein
MVLLPISELKREHFQYGDVYHFIKDEICPEYQSMTTIKTVVKYDDMRDDNGLELFHKELGWIKPSFTEVIWASDNQSDYNQPEPTDNITKYNSEAS